MPLACFLADSSNLGVFIGLFELLTDPSLIIHSVDLIGDSVIVYVIWSASIEFIVLNRSAPQVCGQFLFEI